MPFKEAKSQFDDYNLFLFFIFSMAIWNSISSSSTKGYYFFVKGTRLSMTFTFTTIRHNIAKSTDCELVYIAKNRHLYLMGNDSNVGLVTHGSRLAMNFQKLTPRDTILIILVSLLCYHSISLRNIEVLAYIRNTKVWSTHK